tara:strand:+ start:1123 stop:1269 length:147 start_codon:yes stop_codon:yes gene_type:complete
MKCIARFFDEQLSKQWEALYPLFKLLTSGKYTNTSKIQLVVLENSNVK